MSIPPPFRQDIYIVPQEHGEDVDVPMYVPEDDELPDLICEACGAVVRDNDTCDCPVN